MTDVVTSKHMVKLGPATETNPFKEEAAQADQIANLLRAAFTDKDTQFTELDEKALSLMSDDDQSVYNSLREAHANFDNYQLKNHLQVRIDNSLEGRTHAEKLAILQKFIIPATKK